MPPPQRCFPTAPTLRGVDPEPALNWTKDNMKDVHFYGVFGSAPCNKIRSYFKYFKIPFMMTAAQTKPDGDEYYKKMPVVDVNGRQVNDSYIIIKNVAAACFDKFDEAWEEKITFSMLYDIEACMSQEEVADWAWHPDYGFGLPGCMKCCMSGMIFGVVTKNIAKASDKEKNPQGYMKVVRNNDAGVAVMKEFMTEVHAGGESPKFHGGESPDQVDLSMYATLMGFYSVFKVPSIVKAVNDAGMADWYVNMTGVLPVETLYPAVVPDLTKLQ